MSMTSEQFEHLCLSCTLRTLKLAPRDILDPDRQPENQNDPLLEVARPTWIGKEYQVRGVLLLGKNPAGGTTSYQQASHGPDDILAAALSRLREWQDIESYRAWREAQFRVMTDESSDWRIWRVTIMAIVRSLDIREHAVSFGNLVPFRTANNADPRMGEIRRGWDRDVSHVVALLKPGLIVRLGVDVPRCYQRIGVNVLPFARANGDRFITSQGREHLKTIKVHWDRVIGGSCTGSGVAMSQNIGLTKAGAPMSTTAPFAGPFVRTNEAILKEKANRKGDPRYPFYEAMLSCNTYEDYFRKVGGLVVQPATYRSRPVTAQMEIRYAKTRRWIADRTSASKSQ